MSPLIRPVQAQDIDRIFLIRTSVKENHMSMADLERRGIAPEAVWTELASGELGGWVSEENGTVVAFSMARNSDASIFALFTLPGHEGRGHGTALLERAENWLREQGHAEAWLSSGEDTTASCFYARRGWLEAGRSTEFAEDIAFRKRLAATAEQ
jgi:GNAT superfamily N-acetyltransferase